MVEVSRVRSARRRGAWLPALALAVAAALPGAGRAQEGFPSELKTVAAVHLDGRHHVPAKEIWLILKTRRPSIFPWRVRPVLRTDFLNADDDAIEALYRQHGYLDARVGYRLEATRSPRSVIVHFEIDEGRRSIISAVELDGVRAINPDPLRRKLLSRPGRPFNPSAMVLDTVIISNAYKERGYLPDIAASSHRDSLRVRVRYQVEEGPIFHNGRVILAAEDTAGVDPHLVRRELLLKPGETYRASRVQRSVERLYDTGLFSQVRIQPLVDTSSTTIDFAVRTRTRKPRWIDAGVGSGTAERFRFTGEWGHRNLAGRGVQGALSAKLAFDGQARFLLSHIEASLLEPWLMRSRTRGVITIYHENRDDRADPRWLVKQAGDGVSFQLRRDLGRISKVALTLDNAFVTQDLSLFATDLSQPVLDSLTFNVKPSYTTHRLQLAFDRDNRDDPINAGRGSAQSIGGEVAGGPLRGTSSFTKWQVTNMTYTPLRNGWGFATRIRGGVINPFGEVTQFSPDSLVDPEVTRVPLEDRFRIGGVNSLRGYSENELPLSGGLVLLLANAELRIPLAGPLGLEFFVDAGNVWARPEYLKGADLVPKVSHDRLGPNDMRYVVGGGPRLNLPFGPLRIDFTWSLRPDESGQWRVAEPQFAIGPSF